jgi:hypothetical protein
MSDTNKRIKGFLRCGLAPSIRDIDTGETLKGGIRWGKNGKLFVFCELNQSNGVFTYVGAALLYKDQIPEEYREHEFESVYPVGAKPRFVPEIEGELAAIIQDQLTQYITKTRSLGMSEANDC